MLRKKCWNVHLHDIRSVFVLKVCTDIVWFWICSDSIHSIIIAFSFFVTDNKIGDLKLTVQWEKQQQNSHSSRSSRFIA